MQAMRRERVFWGTLSDQRPSRSVVAAVCVPSRITAAPITGSPLSSTITPLTVRALLCCAGSLACGR